ncbi:MAG: hypothetical protein H6733_08005 [Alphaproteobacteria bacterium]|nr:hypothetical protein [Alphaproteobacteria bacterium]
MARPTIQRHRHDPLRVLCRIAGTPDIETYLGIAPGMQPKEALVLLERKRRELEAALSDPLRAREAELFLDIYALIRDRIGRTVAVDRAFGADTPDYYQVLGVQPGATYAAIERAWRQVQQRGEDVDPIVAQAWRVLGDPLNRANYDRSRRESIDPHAPPPGAPIGVGASGRSAPDPDELVDDDVGPSLPGPAHDPSTDDLAIHAELPGPDVREILLDGQQTAVLSIPLVVRGKGRWRATLSVDHPAVTTQPERMVSVGPGRHTLAVHVDPRLVRQHTLTVTLTLSNSHEQHVIPLRIRRAGTPWHRRIETAALLAGAVALLATGWLLGTTTTVTATARGPSSVGHISQIPTAAVCFEAAYAPLPSYVDVHTDGLGRPTGFSFGGVGSPESEACVRQALVNLDFPPTRDGLPALHRYTIPPPQGTPP